MRQENYEAPSEGSASGISSKSRAGKILSSLVTPFIRGWQQGRPAVVYTPHEKTGQEWLNEEYGFDPNQVELKGPFEKIDIESYLKKDYLIIRRHME